MAYNQNVVTVVNRTTRPLDVMDDGRPYVIPPGYVKVPDVDPETGEQRVQKTKDPRDPKKTIEAPLFKIVGAGKPDKVTGVQEASHDGKPFEFHMLAGAAVRARRQHILRGSQDPSNPQFAETLVAIVEIGDPTDHQEQVEDPDAELLDESLLADDVRQKRQRIRNPHHLSRERRRSLVDPRLTNLVGLRMDY